MIQSTDETLLRELGAWFQGASSISRAWLFGSRATGSASEASDIDIAIELTPEDGQVLAEWLEHAAAWQKEINFEIQTDLKIDLQLAHAGHDNVVWPAVVEHGIVIFEREVPNVS